MFPPSVNQMHNRQIGMTEEHARAGKPHNQLNILTFVGAITVGSAIDTRGFFIAMRTFGNALFGIVCECATRIAQSRIRIMVILAIQSNHNSDGFRLALQSR